MGKKKNQNLNKDQRSSVEPILRRILTEKTGPDWAKEYSSDRGGFVAGHLAHIFFSLRTIYLHTIKKEIEKSIATEDEKEELLNALENPQQSAA